VGNVASGSRCRGGAWLTALCVGAWASGTAAQPTAPLGVDRDPGTEECPDGDALAARIERIRGRPSPDPSPYLVRFSREEDHFVATIGTRDRSHVRTLESHRPSCAALGDAVAVTLALLYDADLAAPAPAPPPLPPPVPPTQAAPAESERLRPGLGAGAAWVVGVTAPYSFAGQAEVGLYAPRWQAGLGVLWIAPETHRLGPGTVEQQMLGANARLCVAPVAADPVGMDVCSGVLAGAMTGRASGYTRNDTRSRPWVAVPLELVLRSTMQSVNIELGVGALVPIARDDFTVDGVGTAYESSSVAGMASVRIVALVR
jgi:hypothetical protein